MNQKEIADFLKQLRISKNMTQRELAKEMNVTPQAVSRWENSNSIPDINTLKRIAEFYGISVDEILKAQKNVIVAIPVKKEKPKVWKYICLYFGLIISLIGMSFFIVVFRHYVLNILFVIIGLILCTMIIRKVKRKSFFIAYFIITGLLIVLTLLLVLPNLQYYLIENEQRMQLTESKEILYPRDLAFDTHVETYEYIFNQYALIYTENEVDISVFNLSEFHSESEYTILTNQMIVKDLVVVGNHIYFSTFIEDIPGEFKLFELDFATHDITLLYQSNHIFNLFEAYESLYLVTDSIYNFEDSKVYQVVDQQVEHLYDLEYQIHEMISYQINYEQKLLVSTHDSEHTSSGREYKVAVVDYYNFEIDQYILGNLENIYNFQSTRHNFYGYNKYNGTKLYKFEGYDATLVLTHDHVEYFKLLSDDLYLIDDELYDKNNDMIQDYMFYDDAYYKSRAHIIINDGNDNYYVIDHELIGFVIEYPDELHTWNLKFTTRLWLFIPSLFIVGVFVSWGQKRKNSTLK